VVCVILPRPHLLASDSQLERRCARALPQMPRSGRSSAGRCATLEAALSTGCLVMVIPRVGRAGAEEGDNQVTKGVITNQHSGAPRGVSLRRERDWSPLSCFYHLTSNAHPRTNGEPSRFRFACTPLHLGERREISGIGMGKG